MIITGDMNAKVGEDNEDMEHVRGKHGLGIRNNNGERLCEYCEMNEYAITHKDIPPQRYTGQGYVAIP